MSKRVKIILIIIGIVAALSVVIIGGSFFYIQSESAGRQLQSQINSRIPGQIVFKDYNLSLLKGRIELGSILLKNPEGEVEVDVDQLVLQVSWRALFSKCITIEEVYLKDSNVRIFIDEAGALGITRVFVTEKGSEEKPEPEPSKEEGTLFNFVLTSFLMENGSVIFEDPAKHTSAKLDGIRIECSGNLNEQAWKIDVSTKDGKYDGEGMSVAVELLKICGVMEKERVSDLHIYIKTPLSELSLKGAVQDILSDPSVDLALELGLDLPELKKTLALAPRLEGKISGTLSAKGAVKNPDLVLALAHSGGALTDFELDAIQLKATLKDRILQIDPLEVMVPSGSIKARGESDLRGVYPDGFLALSKGFDLLSYTLDLAINHVALKDLLKEKFTGEANIGGAIHVSGKGTSAETAAAKLDLDITGAGVTTGSPIAPINISLTSKATLNQGEAVFDALSLGAGPTKIDAAGSYHLSSKALNVTLTADSKDLAETLLPLGVQGVKGAVNIQAEASGSVDRPSFKLVVNGTDIRLEKADIGNLDLTASLDKSGLLEISELTISNQGSVLKGAGKTRLFKEGADGGTFAESIAKVDASLPIDFNLMLKDIEAADFIEDPPVSGLLEGKIVIGGDLTDLTADIDLKAKKLAAKASQIGDVAFLAKLADGILVIDKLFIKNKKSALKLSGSAGVFTPHTLKPMDDPPIALDVKADTIYLQDFLEEMKATASINATISGTAKKPQGEFDIQAKQIDLGAQKLEEIRLKGVFKDEKVNLSTLLVQISKDQAIQGDGWISMDQRYNLRLASKGISLDQIDAVREKNIAKGVIVLDLAGEGAFDNPKLSGTVAINDFRVNDKDLGNVKIELKLSDFMATVKGKLNFDISATYQIKSQDFSANLNFSNTDLTPYFSLADAKNFTGNITGKIQASGNASDPSKISGDAQFELLDLFMKEQELAHAENFEISFKDQKVSIPGLALRLLKDGNLTIQGNADLQGPLAIKADGSIPLDGLALVKDTLPGITGTIKLSANVGGTVEKPAVSSEIILEKIGFTVPELMQKFHDLNGRIIISPEALEIEKLQGMLDKGQIELSGKVALEDMKPGQIKMDLSMRALPIKVPDMLDILLQSDLSFSGDLKKDSTLKGDIVIVEGVYHKDINVSLTSGVTEKKRAQSVKTEKATNPMLEKMKLDISIKRRNPFLVDNNIAYLDINPDIRITGTAQAPMIQGRTSIESGTITYQKKEFEVKKGVIDFLDPYKLVPTLDIESTVQIRTWLINLAISGDPDNLVFTLSSNPPEEDGDIISLIVLGKTSEELMGGSGGGKSAEQMLAEMVATTFGDDIKQMTGLDHFEMESANDPGSETESEGVKVTVGKNLSERLTVKYSTDSRAGEMVQRAISEYKLLENLVISGFQDSMGIFGGELQYRLDFQ